VDDLLGDVLDLDAASAEWQLKRAAEVGFCERPIFLVGRDSSGAARRLVAVRCKSRRAARCVPCSIAYQLDARRLVRLGFAPERRSLPDVRWWWLTLTAPGIKLTGSPVHTVRRVGSRVLPCSPRSCLVCGRGIVCRTRHGADDGCVGAPFEGHEDCYRYWAAVRWNRNVPELWNETLLALRASLRGRLWTLQYAKVVQWQARGAAHIHAVLRTTASGAEIREAVAAARVQGWGWGSQLRLERLAAAGNETTPQSAAAISARIDYLCRYATRDVRVLVPSTPGTLRELHLHRLREQARAMATDSSDPSRFADGLGYGGRTLTHSRRWGASFASLAEERRSFAAAVADGSKPKALPVPLTWSVAGSGWIPGSIAQSVTTQMFAAEKPVGFSAFGDLPAFRQAVPGDDEHNIAETELSYFDELI
jgi:hypothetical protein